MVTINDAESMDDLTDFIAAKVKANFVCIPRSSLPELPGGIEPEFTAKNMKQMDWMDSDWEWLAALLNAVYGKGE